MGLDIELQDERGGPLESISDPQNLLGRLLPPNSDESCLLVASIDPYGDTVFNRIQMERFLREWRVVSAKAQKNAPNNRAVRASHPFESRPAHQSRFLES